MRIAKRSYIQLAVVVALAGFVHAKSFAGSQTCGYLEVHAPSGYTITDHKFYHGAKSGFTTAKNDQVAILEQSITKGPDYLLTMTNSSNGNSFEVRAQQNFCSTAAGGVTVGCPLANNGACKDDYGDNETTEQNSLIINANPSSLRLFSQVLGGEYGAAGGVVCLSVTDMNIPGEQKKGWMTGTSSSISQKINQVTGALSSFISGSLGNLKDPAAVVNCPEDNS